MLRRIVLCVLLASFCGSATALAQDTEAAAEDRATSFQAVSGGTQEDVELLCGQCHGMVHATYTNRTLAASYSTLDVLRRSPELEKYLRWVRKQPATRRTRNAPRRRKL